MALPLHPSPLNSLAISGGTFFCGVPNHAQRKKISSTFHGRATQNEKPSYLTNLGIITKYSNSRLDVTEEPNGIFIFSTYQLLFCAR